MAIQDLVIQLVVVLGFGIWAYSKIKGVSLKEAIEEIKGLIG